MASLRALLVCILVFGAIVEAFGENRIISDVYPAGVGVMFIPCSDINILDVGINEELGISDRGGIYFKLRQFVLCNVELVNNGTVRNYYVVTYDPVFIRRIGWESGKPMDVDFGYDDFRWPSSAIKEEYSCNRDLIDLKSVYANRSSKPRTVCVGCLCICGLSSGSDVAQRGGLRLHLTQSFSEGFIRSFKTGLARPPEQEGEYCIGCKDYECEQADPKYSFLKPMATLLLGLVGMYYSWRELYFRPERRGWLSFGGVLGSFSILCYGGIRLVQILYGL
jgi:hypothetical protein